MLDRPVNRSLGSHVPSVIRSAANTQFRRLLALSGSARARSQAGVVVLEGLHLLQEWQAAGVYAAERTKSPGAAADPERMATPAPEASPGLLAIYFAERSMHEEPFAGWRVRHADRAFVLADRLFERVSDVGHGVGPIAVITQPSAPALPTAGCDIVYLDRIQDPGNVGTILRTCAATGLREVWCAPGTAACWSPKVLRAAAGAHFRLSIRESVVPDPGGPDALPPAWATVAAGGRSLYECDLRDHALWLFGNEGQGLAPTLARHARSVTIPQVAAIESLNVGVAAALCLYEQWRQRGFPRAATG